MDSFYFNRVKLQQVNTNNKYIFTKAQHRSTHSQPENQFYARSIKQSLHSLGTIWFISQVYNVICSQVTYNYSLGHCLYLKYKHVNYSVAQKIQIITIFLLLLCLILLCQLMPATLSVLETVIKLLINIIKDFLCHKAHELNIRNYRYVAYLQLRLSEKRILPLPIHLLLYHIHFPF